VRWRPGCGDCAVFGAVRGGIFVDFYHMYGRLLP
jgi:hypothetical protein